MDPPRERMGGKNVGAMRQAWLLFAVGCFALIGLFFLVQSEVLRESVYTFLPLSAGVAGIVGVRRWQPEFGLAWALFAVANLLFAVGNSMYLYYAVILDRAPPFPSVADLFFLAFQLVVCAALAVLLHRRGASRPEFIDAVIVGITVAFVAWIVLIRPHVSLGDFSNAGLTVTFAYQAAYVLNVIVLMRLLLAREVGTFGLRILEAALVSLVVGVIGYAVLSATGTYRTGHAIDALILLAVGGIGAAGLHPSLAERSKPEPSSRQNLTAPLVALYLVTLLAGPTILVTQRTSLGSLDALLLLLATAVISCLVVGRLVGLVREVGTTQEGQRSALEALAVSEDRYRTLVEGLPGAVYIAEGGPKGTWHYVSPQIEDLLGYSPEKWMESPLTWLESIAPEDRDRVIAREAAAVESGGEYVSEYRMQRSDGTSLWVRDRARCIPGEEGVLQGVLIDVTEQHEAEERLRLAHERFAALIRNSSDVIIIVSVESTITFASDSVVQLGGFEPQELIGVSAFDMLHEDDRPAAVAAFEDIARDPAADSHLEARATTRSGDWVWVEIHAANALADPAVEGVILNVRDISDRKEHEAHRQASEARKTAMLEVALDAIVSMDDQGLVVEFNPAAEKMFGYSADHAVGRAVEELLVPPGMRDRHRAGLRRHLLTGKSRILGQRVELEALRADGTTFPAEIAINRAKTDLPFFSAFIRDLTEQKAEQRHQRNLEQKAERSQRLETVGQLAGGIAHDFNNILSVILNYAMFIHDALPEDEEVRQDCAEIITAAQRAANMTRQLLVFSRRESVKPEILNLNRLLRDMHDMLRRTMREDIQLDLQLDDGLPNLKGDRSRLEQVVLNLVVNARDAMPGGGTLTVTTAHMDIDRSDGTYSALDPGRYVVLEVSDTGIGISDEVKDRMFEPFFTTKEKAGGTGLGLATVFGIVTGARGDIELVSAPGAGTTFRILLPAADEGESVELSRTPVDLAQRHYTVLVVEDEPSVRASISRILERAGCTVTAPVSGSEAIRMVEEGEIDPDVLLTDVVMPELSGRQVAERIGAPTVFMSGYSNEGGLDSDAVLLTKPFDPSDLLRSIDEVVTAARELSTPTSDRSAPGEAR